MKEIALIAALTLIGACSVKPEAMFYEVTQRSANGVTIQANIGNLDRQSSFMAQMQAHMDGMAGVECEGLGRGSANVTNQNISTSGPYYTWMTRTYSCQ